MMLFFALIAASIPAVIGRQMLATIEGKTPLFTAMERWAIGFILGQTLCMFAVFLLHVTFGVPLTLTGFSLCFAVLAALVFAPVASKRASLRPVSAPLSESAVMNGAQKLIIAGLGVWTLLKIVTATFLLLATPPYHDDTVNNWNYRGKAFFVNQAITLELPLVNNGISSYPPTVPLLKTWTATLTGEWNEAAVNAMHMLWFLCAPVLIFFALRRHMNVFRSLLGAYAVASLPLLIMQSTVAYADVFLSLHILIAIGAVFRAQNATDPERKRLLAVAALTIGLIAFVKNEGLLLYAPPLAVTLLWTALRTSNASERMRIGLGCVLLMSAVIVPWLMFKWAHDLPFGNAKAVGSLAFGWQNGVLHAALINTFFEGNWSILFALFFGLLVRERESAFRLPLLPITFFVLTVIIGQLLLYLFTGLSVEAVQQTGYARGMLHLVPSIVPLTALLLGVALDKHRKDSGV